MKVKSTAPAFRIVSIIYQQHMRYFSQKKKKKTCDFQIVPDDETFHSLIFSPCRPNNDSQHSLQ